MTKILNTYELFIFWNILQKQELMRQKHDLVLRTSKKTKKKNQKKPPNQN